MNSTKSKATVGGGDVTRATVGGGGVTRATEVYDIFHYNK